MAKALQPCAGFAIENNRVNFYSDRIFPWTTDEDQKSVMLSEM